LSMRRNTYLVHQRQELHPQGLCLYHIPDRRWLRFLVRGTEPENAIMTAVDQAGNRVARYRQLADDPDPGGWGEVVITVHPDRELTHELVLAIVISAGWPGSYFNSPDSGKAHRAS
jgi:hypothetical protein